MNVLDKEKKIEELYNALTELGELHQKGKTGPVTLSRMYFQKLGDFIEKVWNAGRVEGFKEGKEFWVKNIDQS